jgi:DNA-binding response OmpR family regulator
MPKRVLVVDDEKLIVKGIRFSLEQDDMEVDTAGDGEEAVQKAREGNYDIILLDLMLPKLDGLSACQFDSRHTFKETCEDSRVRSPYDEGHIL